MEDSNILRELINQLEAAVCQRMDTNRGTYQDNIEYVIQDLIRPVILKNTNLRNTDTPIPADLKSIPLTLEMKTVINEYAAAVQNSKMPGTVYTVKWLAGFAREILSLKKD